MNESEYLLFLSVGTWICAVGSALTLLKLKKRGSSALILSAAFLAMGGLLWMIKVHAQSQFVTLGAVVLALLLVADLVVRSRDRESQP
jgi:hypothetical protein